MKPLICTGLIPAAMSIVLSTTATAGPQPVRVTGFEQEVGVSYHHDPAMPDGVVHAVVTAFDDSVIAATDAGLLRLHQGEWLPVESIPSVPVLCLAASEHAVYAATESELYQLTARAAEQISAAIPGAPTALAAGSDGVLWLGTAQGLVRIHGSDIAIETELNDLLRDRPAIRQIAVSRNGQVSAATAAGLFTRTTEGWQRHFPRSGDAGWTADDVRGTAYDQDGRLWFCCPQGVGCLDGQWKLFTGRDGLPWNDFTVAAPGNSGVMWFGTRQGAICFDGVHWRYREGRRWLPNNDVRDIAVSPQGRTWLATADGVGLIDRRPMTLAQKARFYEDEIDARHRRTPWEYVQWVVLDKPGDKNAWRQRDDDNDGQWTGEYGAAECFRYAVTRDPEAKERATKAFEALRFLSQVSQGGSHPAPRGFPARTIWPADDTRNPNREASYSIEADERTRNSDALWKVIHPRWPTSADGKWYWKCDTSSDELDGHYFLNACYYDLVAETEEEKERVRKVVRDMTDHLLEHEFRLVDHDGLPTRWANFSPKSLNHDPHWWAERGLNSLSVLSYLRTASHITGDPKYNAAADALIRDESYAMNVMYPKNQRGPGSFVQFDDEMAFMCYYNLIRYETDPTLRDMFRLSCHNYWELEEPETNALYNLIYAAVCEDATITTQWGSQDLSASQTCIDDAVETLRRYPIDLVSWKMTNSHRLDLVPLSPLVRDAGESKGKGSRVNGRVLPIDERFINYWSDDPWKLDSGGDGRQLATGMPYLLAYYLGVYHGFIVEQSDR